MPGRMESMENLVAAAEPGSRSRGWFSTLPTAPWKSLRDSHSSTAPTTTILSYEQKTPGDTSIERVIVKCCGRGGSGGALWNHHSILEFLSF